MHAYSDLKPATGDGPGGPGLSREGTYHKLTPHCTAGLLAPVLPAVRGLGGDLQVVSIQPSAGAVTIAYKGPEKLTYGIELTLKDHPKINTISFTALA